MRWRLTPVRDADSMRVSPSTDGAPATDLPAGYRLSLEINPAPVDRRFIDDQLGEYNAHAA
jgi:hypothetical protein